MKNKLIALLLLLALLLTGCGAAQGDADNPQDGTTAETAADVTETEDEQKIIKEIIAGKDFGGREFNIGWSIQYGFNEVAFTLEETAGDSINEAVYERNRLAEEALNVKIKGTNICDWVDILSTIQKMMNAGDCPYDAFCCSMWFMYLCSVNGYLYELNNIAGLGLENAWWEGEKLEMYSLGSNSLYFVSGAINYLDDLSISILLFNKVLCDNNGIEYPYQMVRDGTWVLDRLFELATSYGSDVDGDGKYTTNDTYGFTENAGVFNRLLAGSGEGVLKIASDGSVTLNQSEKMMDVFLRVRNNLTAKSIKTTVIADREIDNNKTNKMFRDGQILVGSYQVNSVFGLRQEMEDDFGIIPSPKYDESQTEYFDLYSTASGSCYAIPVTNTALEDTGLIMNVMGFYSQDTILPTVIDKNVLTKGTRDEESAEMLELIFTTKFYDLGQWGSDIYGSLCSLIISDKDNIASVMAKMESKTQKQFAPIQQYYKFG